MSLVRYHLGYEVGRYISLERLIEENKERYYETLQQSSRGWHEGKHDPWPYINYLFFIVTSAYKEFESRLGQIKDERGAKTGLIEASIQTMDASFSVADLLRLCPGVSIDMIRHVLDKLREDGVVACVTRGRSARWKRIR